MAKPKRTRLIRLILVIALACPVLLAGAATPAHSQTDSSFTGGIFDSFGAKVETTAGLHFDPIIAYVQGVTADQSPLMTGHGYIMFPGTLLASSIITGGASQDYPRWGGQLPSETICGDPGNLKRAEPEIRDPRPHNPPNRPYYSDCDPGTTDPQKGQCDVRSRGNPVSWSALTANAPQQFKDAAGNRMDFASGYGVSECNAKKLFAYSDQRAQGVSLLPVGTTSSAGGAPAPPQLPGVTQTGGGVVPNPGASVLPSIVPTGTNPQQTTVYAINMGSVSTFSKLEVLGPGLTGAAVSGVDAEASPPLATTGTFNDRLTLLGLIALAASVIAWGLSRRIGGGRMLSIAAAAATVGYTVFGFAPKAQSAEQTRLVGSVTSKANDVVITSGAVEIFRVAEVTVTAKAEAAGQPGTAKTDVTRTIRGVKVLGQDRSDLSQDKINAELAATGLSFQLGEVKRTAETDGSAASVEATGLILEQEFSQGLVGGADVPHMKLVLARATPSVSFFSLASFALGSGVDFGSGLTQEFSGTQGEAAGTGSTVGGTFATPQNTSVPGVKQVGPGKYILQGKFAGFDFEGVKFKLWSFKDMLEAAGGVLLVIAVVLAARHRRRFSAPKTA